MKQLITILIIIFTFISCNTSDKSKKNTYFGGQIINPKSNNIILMKDEKVLDTLW
ncbi:MAG: thioredoxin-related protein, partial [Saprospiraceae bacterium]